MAKIHALTCDSSGNTRVVLHTATPAGNNAVGNGWKSVWIANGRNTTSLTVGTGLGQITTAEQASVVAGDVIEIAGVIPINIVAQGATAVNTFADALIASALALLSQQLNYFGWVNG